MEPAQQLPALKTHWLMVTMSFVLPYHCNSEPLVLIEFEQEELTNLTNPKLMRRMTTSTQC